MSELSREPPGRSALEARSDCSCCEEGGGALAPAGGRSRVGRPKFLGTSPWTAVILRATGGAVVLLALAVIGAGSLGNDHGALSVAASLPLGRDGATSWLAGAVELSGAAPARPPQQGPVAVPAGLPPERRQFPAASDAGPSSPPKEACDGSDCAPKQGTEPGGITADGKVVLNLATREELTRLPGVGPKRAESIIVLRTKLKRFRRPSDLLRVRGIGPKTLRRMLPHLVVDPPSAQAPAPEAPHAPSPERTPP